MRYEFKSSAVWTEVHAHVTERIRKHIIALRRPGTPIEKTEYLRGQLDELERILRLQEHPAEIDTTPTA